MLGKSFYCGICFKEYENYSGLSMNNSLDWHLAREHFLPVGREDGKATIAANGLKKNPYKPEIPFTFRRQS